MTTLLAILLGLAALASDPAPPDFVTGALARGEPVVTPGFLGLEWRCRLDDDERCYAGLSYGALGIGAVGVELVTGP